MEAVDRRGHVLLGHAPRDPFSGEEIKQRGSTDFSDVFGGPPRRYSICENRSSLEDRSSLDSDSGGRIDREDSAEIEKPVFGGLNSPAHRRHLGDGFFNDIFRGSESPCPTPRKLDRDRVTYTPSSSFRSPFRPLPPATDISGEEFDSKSRNLSYSSRQAKTSDYSPHKPPVSRNSHKEDQRTPPSKSPSRLSVPNVHPTHGDEIKGSEDSQIKVELYSKDKIVIDDNLHFSMYKWASKGVTLILPPNLKDKSKVRSRLGVYAQVSQEPDLPLDKGNLPQGIPIIQNPDVPEDVTITRSPNPSPVETKKAPGVLRDKTDKSDDAGFSVEMRKPMNFHQLIDEELEIEGKEARVVDFKKSTRGIREDKNPHHLPRSSSKVKESVKNFESRAVENRESIEAKVEEHRQSSTIGNKDENKLTNPAPAIPSPPKLETERVPSDDSGMQREIGRAPVTFSVSRNSVDISFCEIDVTDFEILDDCMLEDLSQECDEATETSSLEEEIRKSHAKILEWSKGRQGNIRSLLSTLQNVLWPECGWKPVKLVDLIEGSSVRRAYQRALLYLHPDKLQQKGADMHHKYIAEKVFDILQEAWNHFNSLGAI